MSTPAAIEKHVIAVGLLKTENAKRGYLQALIGPPSSDRATLQFRALLVTALVQAQVWPHRVLRESAFDE